MRLIRDLSALPAMARGAVLALGNFDGLHEGHRAVLEATKALAQEQNAPLGVMTFEPHPRRLFKPELPVLRLLPLAEKLRRLREFGVDCLFMLRFNRAFSQTTAAAFVEDLLVEKLAVRGVVTGENFIFGHQRQGDSVYLAQQAQRFGFESRTVPSVKILGDTCSSTRLRGALAGGDVEMAAALLGHPYYMTGRILRGDRRGHALGFPTANLHPARLFYPAFGIYVAKLRIAAESLLPPLRGEVGRRGHPVIDRPAVTPPLPGPPPQGGRAYNGVASFGLRPMYALEAPLLETHLFDVDIDLYGKKVSVELLHYLRGEQKFGSEAALIAQMQEDAAQARAWFRERKSA